MTTGSVTLAWIDSREAFVVRWQGGEAKVDHLESDVPVHRVASGFTPQDVVEGHRLEHLTRFVGRIATLLPTDDDLLLIGPGTAREHLANEISRRDAQAHRARRVACRAARPMSVPQLVALLRHEIGDEPPRKPLRRRLKTPRRLTRREAQARIHSANEMNQED
jgi:hypothetical protein